MEPSIQYALNRRPHLLMAMVGAALRSLPHQTGTLRGSTESEARAAYTPVAVKVLDQMIDGQEVNEDILWSAGGQIVAQFGIGIAVAMLNELSAKLCPKRSKAQEQTKQDATGSKQNIAPRNDSPKRRKQSSPLSLSS